jgi:hypothetical protein
MIRQVDAFHVGVKWLCFSATIGNRVLGLAAPYLAFAPASSVRPVDGLGVFFISAPAVAVDLTDDVGALPRSWTARAPFPDGRVPDGRTAPPDAPTATIDTLIGLIGWCRGDLAARRLEMIVLDQTHPRHRAARGQGRRTRAAALLAPLRTRASLRCAGGDGLAGPAAR